ncbi:MAG TPA: Hpt domain-containing protein [Bryobacteraceae bacterium]|nr:Hpt domain-containing protein [Bryobacteraceae bacterium]
MNTPQDASKKSVLIIDEDAAELGALQEALAGAGYRVETARTAGPVLTRWITPHPHGIVVDAALRGADGLPLAHRLLAEEGLLDVPVLALGGGVVSGRQPPFDGCIERPVRPAVLLEQLRTCLNAAAGQTASPSGDAVGAGGGGGGEEHRATAEALLAWIVAGLPETQFTGRARAGLRQLAAVVPPVWSPEVLRYLRQAEQLTGMNTARARERFGSLVRLCRDRLESDPAPAFQALRAEYLDHCWAGLRNLQQALRQEDYPALQSAGHNLKGTGAAYGFEQLTELGRGMEMAARNGDSGVVEILVGEIESYLAMVRDPGKE